MSLFKNSFDYITEMAKGESGTSDDDLTVQLTNIDFGDMLDDMDSVMMGEIELKAEMVTVRECKRLGKDLVEIDELAKYMHSSGIRNFKEAINNIAEVNGRDASKFAVVIDESAIRQAVKEAECSLKCPDEIYAKAKVDGVVDTKKVLDILYNSDIDVVKK